jgi:8-oxo-dGTP pyrophosphatase MutT (NUDIX family)
MFVWSQGPFSTQMSQPTDPERDAAIDALEQFLRARLSLPLPGAAAQQRFAPLPLLADWSPDLTPATARLAAALLLFYPTALGPTLALTVRHTSLPHHAGQISLPGGALDPGETPEAAATREAAEEIGVEPDRLRLVGALSPLWIPVSNFVVTPFVAVTDTRPAFRLHPGEVEALVEAPLSHLRDKAHIRWAQRQRLEQLVDYPFIAIDTHKVWGATAMMLSEFLCLFDDDHAPPPIA